MAFSIVHKSKHFIPYVFYSYASVQVNCRFIPPTFLCQLRFNSKHWDPKWKKQRAEKVQKVFLPNFNEERENAKLSTDEIRAKLKEKGIAPHRSWTEKPIYIGCTGDIFEAYVPPEGDGKISAISTSGVKQAYESFGKKTKSYKALRKIRSIESDFDVPTVAEKAQEIYIQAQNALIAKDEDKLHDLVTEKAFPEMMENVKCKTLVWKFIQALEPPRIVQVRMEDLLSKSNSFGQVTVRMHTQQSLAIYDRFGRLMHGSEDVVKDVLEYIVFEKHLTNPYGTWKIHAKIIPDWMPPRDPIQKTYPMPDIDKEFPEPPKSKPPPSEDTSKDETGGEPALATA